MKKGLLFFYVFVFAALVVVVLSSCRVVVAFFYPNAHVCACGIARRYLVDLFFIPQSWRGGIVWGNSLEQKETPC